MFNEEPKTENQKKLVRFINKYRDNSGGNFPTLREMIKGIGLSDTKSVLVMIDNLITQGYLIKEDRKSRSVRLTNKALQYVDQLLLPINFKDLLNPIDRIKPLNSVNFNSVSVVSSLASTMGYSNKELKANGTDLNEIRSIVETLSNIIVDYFESDLMAVTPINTNNGLLYQVLKLISRLMVDGRFTKMLGWTLILFLVGVYSLVIFGKNASGLMATSYLFGLIFIISLLDKKI